MRKCEQRVEWGGKSFCLLISRGFSPCFAIFSTRDLHMLCRKKMSLLSGRLMFSPEFSLPTITITTYNKVI